MNGKLTNPILYWYSDTFTHQMVTVVWDYMIANGIKGKPVAMTANEFKRRYAGRDVNEFLNYPVKTL
jgi:hypothetical protein